MPKIIFRLYAAPSSLQSIVDNFRSLVEALGDGWEGDFSYSDNPQSIPHIDSSLEQRWMDGDYADENYGEEEPQIAEFILDIRRYDYGSVSSLAMNCAELLTVHPQEEQNNDPLHRHIQDNPGTPRVPWHLEVLPH